MLGQKVEEYILAEQSAGRHSREIQLGHLDSGVFFYSLEVNAVHSATRYQLTKRMVLIK
jgi:hypothetical protein